MRFWPADADDLATGLAAAGVDVAALDGDALSDTERLNAGGSFSWQLSGARSVEVFGLYGRSDADHAASSLPGAVVPASLEGDDLLAGLSATARLSDRVDGQLRAGLTRSSRSYGAASLVDSGLGEGAVLFAPTGAQLGDPAYPATVDRSEISAEGSLFYGGGSHQLKAGLGARFTSHEQTTGGRGLYLFDDAAGFATRTGVFRGLDRVPTASFSVTELFVHGQDSWRAAPGLQLTSGLSYEVETLPAGDLVASRRWQELTGIDNTDLPDYTGDVGLVLGFDWDVQERQVWRVSGGLSVQRGDVAPELLAEALGYDGRVAASMILGDVASTPTPLGPRLTIVSPDFAAPVTTRANVGLSRAIGPTAALHLGAVIRETDHLPRRTDLNRPAAAPFSDQYGRPVLGRLAREGGLLFPEPGANRAFGEFDIVSALASNASSSYWGVTAGLEKRFGALEASAFYTYSNTEDDWVGAAGIAPLDGLVPFGDDSGLDDWATGTSDFDIPQRAVANAALTLPFAPSVQVGGSWRWSSGRPFTPGFGRGIDANADGVAGNDPAFIDGDIEGMADLMAEHACLREEEGRFAPRNSCRTDDRNLLDAWVGVRLDVGGVRPELRVEALALSATAAGLVDTALYHLDPGAAIVTDPATGSVTVPLVVNPRFGEALQPSSELSRIRISLRMVF